MNAWTQPYLQIGIFPTQRMLRQEIENQIILPTKTNAVQIRNSFSVIRFVSASTRPTTKMTIVTTATIVAINIFSSFGKTVKLFFN